MYIAAVNSNHPLRYVVPLNEWIPVYAGASGLAIMAFLPTEERRQIVRQTKLKPLTANTIRNPVVLEAELERVRQRGYAFSSGHRNIGTVAMGAPVWGPEARPIGSLVVPMPEARFNRRTESRLAALIVQHADRITDRIGGKRASEI
jgi:IclR family acetate operon transcriptional repressor